VFDTFRFLLFHVKDEIGCAKPDLCEYYCGNRIGCTNFAYPRLMLKIMPVGLKGRDLIALNLCVKMFTVLFAN